MEFELPELFRLLKFTSLKLPEISEAETLKDETLKFEINKINSSAIPDTKGIISVFSRLLVIWFMFIIISFNLMRSPGFGPEFSAWEAEVLPLDYKRVYRIY